MLTGAGGRASKRSLIVRFTVSGQAPCSGAERRNKELDEVSTAILGGAAAGNVPVTWQRHIPYDQEKDAAVEILTYFLRPLAIAAQVDWAGYATIYSLIKRISMRINQPSTHPNE